MVIRVVRPGSERLVDEGLRVGTVRRPPRGVPKAAFAEQNWYDIWFPNLAPSVETMKLARQATTEKDWLAFTKKYRAEMNTPENSRTLDLLAALSQQTTSRSVVIVRTKRIVIARCFVRYSPNAVPSWNSRKRQR